MDTVAVANTVNGTENWSLLISIITFLFSIFTFWFYDRRIKRQEALINAYQIKKHEQEEIETKKAQIRANVVIVDRGKRTIKVFNSGLADAYNVRFEILSGNDNCSFTNTDIFPYEKITQKDSTSLFLLRFSGGTGKLEVKFIWDDEHKIDNEYTQMLSI